MHYVLGACVVHSIEPRGFLVTSPSAHPSQPYSSHQQPPPVRRSTHPHFNASAPAPASHHPPFPVPVIPARHPSTNSSGPLAPMMQRSTTIPIPVHPNTALSATYHDSSPPSIVYPSSHSEI